MLGTASVTPALANYRSLCGFPGGSQLPATWPHILAFPLHLRLLTDTTFPLPLLGLVHLRNRIVQHRAIAEGEALDIRVYLDNWVRSHRGIEFDLVTDVMVAGRTVWQETSTNLYRQAKPEATESRGQTQPGDLPRYPNSLEVRADAALGRRYGAVSGDRNPIHLGIRSRPGCLDFPGPLPMVCGVRRIAWRCCSSSRSGEAALSRWRASSRNHCCCRERRN